MRRLIYEALAVGVALAISLAIAQSLVRIRDYKTALLVGLVLGASLHLVFELVGLNRSYCMSGHACKLARSA